MTPISPWPDAVPVFDDDPDDAPLDTSAESPLIGYTLAELATHTFPERQPLLWRGDTVVFRAGHIGQIYAERGVGKTWYTQTLALVAATATEALGFRADVPVNVLYVDGEMGSEEIQQRFAELADRLHVAPPANLTVVGADWQEDYLPRLDTKHGQALIEPFVAAHQLILLDNRSMLFDPDGEKDPAAWQPAQDWLLSLRRRGKGVLAVHHSNRAGGARGISKPEDPMNLLIKLAHPEDYEQEQGARFVVTFDKHRGLYGATVAPYLAHLTLHGWQVQGLEGQAQAAVSAKLVEMVQLAAGAGECMKSANAAIAATKVSRATGLKAWKALLAANTIRKRPEGGFYVP